MSRHPVEFYQEGKVECPGCHEALRLSDYDPLSYAGCAKCGNVVFVPRRIAGFWLFAPVGRGGMGTVYKAYHENYGDMLFAVKKMSPEARGNAVFVKSFETEIQTLKALGEHPCLVRLVGSGDDGGEPYLAMDFIEGEGLDTKIEKYGAMPPLQVVKMALRILSGESHMYQRGYLFRDLKPENILVSEEYGAYLCDYGICMRVEEARRDRGDMLQGSPLYLPPERVLGEGEDCYSEIYSLGMVIYHCLKGRPYYWAPDVEELVQMHINPPEVDLEAKWADVDPWLIKVLSFMMVRRIQDRYQTYVEIERDLYRVFQELLRRSEATP